jgi:hypothetical protein
MCFGIGQNILQASLTDFQLVPDFFEWNPCPYHSSMAALLPTSENGFTAGGMLLADWLNMCQMKSFSEDDNFLSLCTLIPRGVAQNLKFWHA